MDIKGTLTHKVGPLPAIAWAGIAGGIFVGFRYYKARNAAASAPTTATADTTTGAALGYPSTGTSSDFSSGYSDAAGSYVVGTSTPSSASQIYTEPTVATNVDWGQRALNWLIAQNVNPGDASTALASYLNSDGTALNDTQNAALNEAITHFGAPPEGIIAPPPVVVNTPAPPVTTVNTPVTTVMDPSQMPTQTGYSPMAARMALAAGADPTGSLAFYRSQGISDENIGLFGS